MEQHGPLHPVQQHLRGLALNRAWKIVKWPCRLLGAPSDWLSRAVGIDTLKKGPKMMQLRLRLVKVVHSRATWGAGGPPKEGEGQMGLMKVGLSGALSHQQVSEAQPLETRQVPEKIPLEISHPQPLVKPPNPLEAMWKSACVHPLSWKPARFGADSLKQTQHFKASRNTIPQSQPKAF